MTVDVANDLRNAYLGEPPVAIVDFLLVWGWWGGWCGANGKCFGWGWWGWGVVFCNGYCINIWDYCIVVWAWGDKNVSWWKSCFWDIVAYWGWNGGKATCTAWYVGWAWGSGWWGWKWCAWGTACTWQWNDGWQWCSTMWGWGWWWCCAWCKWTSTTAWGNGWCWYYSEISGEWYWYANWWGWWGCCTRWIWYCGGGCWEKYVSPALAAQNWQTYWSWWGWASSSSAACWCQGVFIIRYPCACWYDMKWGTRYLCNWYCIHRFTESWTLSF